MRATDNVCYHIKCNNTFPLVKAECVVFYCLLVHIMYIIHNKATFIVIENISSKIKNSIKFTINNHLLALEYIEYLKSGKHNISAISFSTLNTI